MIRNWRPARRIAAAAAAALVVVMAAPSAVVAAPTIEDQVHAIARELMCPVCAGQTVADSDSQLAQQMRVEIRQRLQAGQTRDEIIAYFVGQFGEGALARPRPKGSGLALWLSLPLALLLGLLVLRQFLRSHLAPAGARPQGPPPATPEESDLIAQALRRLDDPP
jgi:cytochrome c-type biogenesis protein CcmH